MKINALPTPRILLDLDVLERNAAAAQRAADDGGCALWPMIKTHKSLAIARLQAALGARGFLVSTLDEAEILSALGLPLMLAYPLAHPDSFARVRRLREKVRVYCAADSEAALALCAAHLPAGQEVLLIIDTGLHRFGARWEEALPLARFARDKGLQVAGIATHGGHVYGAMNVDPAATAAGVAAAAAQEAGIMRRAAESLREAGFTLSIVAAGATPLYRAEAAGGVFNVIRPGNYIFNDVMQLALGAAAPEDCALTVSATILRAEGNRYVMDCGSKTLGLDKGAHGNPAIIGHGRVLCRPGLVIEGLSEEVGKLTETDPDAPPLTVGSRIRILPNHACVCANMTSFYAGTRSGSFVEWVPVDMRDNLRAPVLEL